MKNSIRKGREVLILVALVLLFCDEVKSQSEKSVVIYFKKNKSKISQKSLMVLDSLGEYLIVNDLEVETYGTAGFNERKRHALAMERSLKTKEYLYKYYLHKTVSNFSEEYIVNDSLNSTTDRYSVRIQIKHPSSVEHK